MKRFLFFILLAFFTLSLTASAQTIDLKVKGVGIGTTYSTVLGKLGKPLSSRKSGSFPCDQGNPSLTLRYSGLVIELIQDNDNRYFFVASMKVTSPKWITSGIRTGESIKGVQKRFGQNNKPGKDAGLENLPYYIKDGYANFYFRNKKLVKIAWELNVC
ncbi:MAG TPA: hypothetical protein VK400_14775 [Pyrinomonadaceae bacterium]|nr:hypothetical protein [Pyrinomonadaceae bacterium]